MIKKLLKNKAFKGVVIAVLCACFLGGVAVVGINAYMISYVSDYILTEDDLAKKCSIALILPLGLREKAAAQLFLNELFILQH